MTTLVPIPNTSNCVQAILQTRSKTSESRSCTWRGESSSLPILDVVRRQKDSDRSNVAAKVLWSALAKRESLMASTRLGSERTVIWLSALRSIRRPFDETWRMINSPL